MTQGHIFLLLTTFPSTMMNVLDSNSEPVTHTAKQKKMENFHQMAKARCEKDYILFAQGPMKMLIQMLSYESESGSISSFHSNQGR